MCAIHRPALDNCVLNSLGEGDHLLTYPSLTQPGMRNKLSVRINTTAQTSGGTRGLAAYTLLSAAASDVDNKKHKKNPFDARYVQLCLSDFAQVRLCAQTRLSVLCMPNSEHASVLQPEQAHREQDIHNSAIDDVADNLHVRVEVSSIFMRRLTRWRGCCRSV